LLAGYRDLTREAYALDLRQFTAWRRNQSLPLFGYDGSDWPHHDGLKWPHPAAVVGAGVVVSA